jgi:hypothetical protein
MPSDDRMDAHQKDWQRRKAISNRYGRPCLVAAAISLIFYLSIEGGLPQEPNSATGHIFKIFWIGRTYGQGPVFVYGTRWDQWLAMSGAGLGIALFLAAGAVYYKYNPGAFYRGVKGQMRE